MQYRTGHDQNHEKKNIYKVKKRIIVGTKLTDDVKAFSQKVQLVI